MSPLDDELRRAMSERALRVQPAADPLADIERRARQIRRTRLACLALGVTVLVAGSAIAVPTLIEATGTENAPEVRLTTVPEPSAVPTPDRPPTPAPTSRPAGTLDPADPWPYRGERSVRTDFLAQVQAAWEGEHPDSTVSPLFGRVYEPSQQPELVFVASGPDGNWWGFAQRTTSVGSTEPVARITQQQKLSAGATALVTVLGADGGGSTVLVVAAPDSRGIFYAPTGGAQQTPMAMPVEGVTGVGIAFRDGDLSRDRVRVVAANGATVYDQAIAPASAAVTPANLLPWPQRGDRVAGPPENALKARFASAFDRTDDIDQVRYRALYAGDTDGGLRFTYGQAWFTGSQDAFGVGLTNGTGAPQPEFFLGPATDPSAAVLAYNISGQPASDEQVLVVIPEPRTTQVSYDSNAAGAFSPATPVPGGDGVYLIDRTLAGTSGSDRLQVLTGKGNQATDVSYQGPVVDLLCGYTSCS